MEDNGQDGSGEHNDERAQHAYGNSEICLLALIRRWKKQTNQKRVLTCFNSSPIYDAEAVTYNTLKGFETTRRLGLM